jgi:hypothetical protein
MVDIKKIFNCFAYLIVTLALALASSVIYPFAPNVTAAPRDATDWHTLGSAAFSADAVYDISLVFWQ